MINEAPIVALELVKIIKNLKTNGYAKGEAIYSFFRINERCNSDKKIAQQLYETRERIYELEDGKPMQLNESPFEIKSSY